MLLKEGEKESAQGEWYVPRYALAMATLGKERVSLEVDTIGLLRKKLDRQAGWHQIGSLTIHFSEDCNLRCHYCSYAEQKDRSSIDPAALDLALAQRPLYTCIVGGGEPTLVDARQASFSSLVARFPQPRSVYMITNGTMLPSGIKEVADRFDFVRLSLDAATAGTYQRLKGVDLFDRVVQNIYGYLEAGVARVGASFVVQKQNIDEVTDVIELLAPVFYAYPQRFFLKFKNLRAAPDHLPSKEMVSRVLGQIGSLHDRSILLGTFLDLATNYQEIAVLSQDTDARLPHAERCYYSLLYCLVRTNGDVYPCGLMSRKERYCVGNILRDPWEAICERQWKFSTSTAGAGCADCAGCWDDRKNLAIQEVLDRGVAVDPFLTRLGGIGNLYCRW